MEGRLKLDQWEDKNTHQKQSKLKVVLEGFSFIDTKGARQRGVRPSAARPPGRRRQPPQRSAPAPAEAEAPEPEQDDVPF